MATIQSGQLAAFDKVEIVGEIHRILQGRIGDGPKIELLGVELGPALRLVSRVDRALRVQDLKGVVTHVPPLRARGMGD